ncbi:helix-turn-helix domain-containing protein [Actinoplanes sp. NBRC 103695]|uniref:helix-turn-helix domain-containing protein n=1 Tax=Actinoplanes sp. NBRC 103695 TaxID=3032202 RepID=UPI0024A03D4B|nr:helix-turn-helix domain-containing protein [Actinoplanes sp. NBRC 103695]GLZ01867.1 hypothetical protein Acsp02_91180 [Actinoplanes sp. NBRC 103695]
MNNATKDIGHVAAGVDAPGGGRVTVLRYGKTVDGLHRIARICAARTGTSLGHSGAGFENRYATAWVVVAEYLYTCGEPPSDELLIGVGSNGVRREQRDDLRSWGWTTADEGGVRATVGFETYWWQSASVTRSPEERIVDALALRQILSALADQDREVLVALAAHEYSIPSAARALGLTVGVMTGRVKRARDRFLALWHEHESPTRKWRMQRSRLPEERLKPCGTPSTYQRHIRHGEYACDECRRAYAAQVKQRLEQARGTGVGAALGARVRELRAGLGWTRAALGLAARVSRTYVFELEHGGRVAAPNRDKVARLDTALGAAGELLAMIDESDGRGREAPPAPVGGDSPVVINPPCQTGEYTEQLVRRIVHATNPMRGVPIPIPTVHTAVLTEDMPTDQRPHRRAGPILVRASVHTAAPTTGDRPRPAGGIATTTPTNGTTIRTGGGNS